MRFVSRSEWGARAPDYRSSIGDVHGCTIHWNGPSVGRLRHPECDDIVRSFQRYHMDSHGWSDIGYNFVVCQHGYVFEGRGLGVRGAHEEDLNAHWYGIQAMVGRGDPIPDALYGGLRDAIAYCRANDGGDRINAHRDADATTCPGDELYVWAHSQPMRDQEDDMPDPGDIAHFEFPRWSPGQYDKPGEMDWVQQTQQSRGYSLAGWHETRENGQKLDKLAEGVDEDRTTFFEENRKLTRQTAANAAAMRGQLDGLIEAMKQQGELDLEAVKQASAQGVRQALAEFELTLDVTEKEK